MRRTTAIMPLGRALKLPRGWVILGLALASWALAAALWVGLSRLFAFVLAAL